MFCNLFLVINILVLFPILQILAKVSVYFSKYVIGTFEAYTKNPERNTSSTHFLFHFISYSPTDLNTHLKNLEIVFQPPNFEVVFQTFIFLKQLLKPS